MLQVPTDQPCVALDMVGAITQSPATWHLHGRHIIRLLFGRRSRVQEKSKQRNKQKLEQDQALDCNKKTHYNDAVDC